MSSQTVIPVQFIMPVEQMGMKDRAACQYLGISRKTLYVKAGEYGLVRNGWGSWNREDLDKIRLKRQTVYQPKAKAARKGSTITINLK